MIIPKQLLSAALLCAATDKNNKGRPMLNAVLVEQGKGGVWIVGTDGVVVFAALHESPDVLDMPSLILPRDALTAALKLDERPDLDVTATTLGALAYQPLDSQYVRWRRVLPGAELSGVWPAHFDSVLLDRAVKAMCMANGAPHHGLNVALFPDTDNIIVRGGRAQCLTKVMAARNVLQHEDKTPVEYEPLLTE